MQGGSGKADDPLKRWKVCFHFVYSYHHYSLLVWEDHERDFPIISRMACDFLAIPGASKTQSRGSSQNLDISALTSEARSTRQPLQRLCVPGNGFMIYEGLFKLN
jgi:hypothetical protein